MHCRIRQAHFANFIIIPRVPKLPLQVWAGCLGVDSRGGPLTCTYETSGTARFQDAIGDIVLRAVKVGQL